MFAAWTAAMAASASAVAPLAATTLATMTTGGAWCAAARLIDTVADRTSAAAAGSGVASPCAVSVVDSSPAVPAIAANAASRAADR